MIILSSIGFKYGNRTIYSNQNTSSEIYDIDKLGQFCMYITSILEGCIEVVFGLV